VVVIAAGNSPQPTPFNPAMLAATIDGVIAVGAAKHDRSLADFSALSGPDPRMQYVTAPGVTILSTLPGNRSGWMDGTSMAAPHVAGVAALMRSALPTADQNRYWAHITGTARHAAAAATGQTPTATVRVTGVTVTAAARADVTRALLFAAAGGDAAVTAQPRTAAHGFFAAASSSVGTGSRWATRAAFATLN
jgi:subtilisin family serine protease